MARHRAYFDFTAQSKSVSALMSLYADLERNDGSECHLIPIVVFIAFSIESYLNSLGARHIQIWDELERLPWKSKVTILHKASQKEAQWGQEPLQFASEVFKLRDKLAHGKPERVFGPVVSQVPVAFPFNPSVDFQPKWYREINKEWTLQGKQRFHQLMVYLGQLFDEHESDYLMMSTGGIITDDGNA